MGGIHHAPMDDDDLLNGRAILQGFISVALEREILPRRQPPSAVMRILLCESLMRSRKASAEKPPKTTLWIAPMRAHANMAMGNSGIIGR